jgi:hypothetical protein
MRIYRITVILAVFLGTPLLSAKTLEIGMRRGNFPTPRIGCVLLVTRRRISRVLRLPADLCRLGRAGLQLQLKKELASRIQLTAMRMVTSLTVPSVCLLLTFLKSQGVLGLGPVLHPQTIPVLQLLVFSMAKEKVSLWKRVQLKILRCHPI